MDHKEFENLIDELEEDSLNTLKKKNSKYAPCDDALRNFHVGASIMGVTTGECVWGYATKHISSLRDRIQRNDWNDLEDVKEKIQDTINYLRFLWCVANEEVNNINKTEEEEDYCGNCKFSNIVYNDDNWDEKLARVVVEPCASCKRNYASDTSEWEFAKDNYERKLC
jgi:hypothetical protein